jgi:manganese transport protein
VLSLVTIIAGCFLLEMVLASPSVPEIASGLIPRISGESLYVAIGILGATVMPHNLYLHSALVQTRRIAASSAEKRVACRYNLIDSVVALNGALLVNAAILILAATVFWKRGIVVTEIEQAHLMLAPLLGTAAASAAFAIALLAAGQSSTMTGTMAGQIVMEGFLNFRMRPWLRRLITRVIAIIPAAITIWMAGESGTYRLLIFSQVLLSMQLPFAVVPLIHFTSDRRRMGAFASPGWVKALAWVIAAIIIALNVWLVITSIAEWMAAVGDYRWLVWLTVVPLCAGLFFLLLWMWFQPFRAAWRARTGRAAGITPETSGPIEAPVYRRVLVTLDHTPLDRVAVAHAATLARTHGSEVYLLHVEEDVTSQVYGGLAQTAETEAGRRYLDEIAGSLSATGIAVVTEIGHSANPTREIVRYAKEIRPDLIIMGAHGHRRFQDLVYGATISPVRHELNVPILVVRDGS